jgi:hypothetical protein
MAGIDTLDGNTLPVGPTRVPLVDDGATHNVRVSNWIREAAAQGFYFLPLSAFGKMNTLCLPHLGAAIVRA